MGHLIDNVGSAAAAWNRHLSWIAINVAYIEAEIPNLESQGCDTKEIKEWLETFPDMRAELTRREQDAYRLIHRYEVNECHLGMVMRPLIVLESVMRDWLEHLHRVHLKVNENANSVAAMLINVCGAQIFEAHGSFKDQLYIFTKLISAGGHFEAKEPATLN